MPVADRGRSAGPVRTKVCGVTTPCAAAVVAEAGADFMGVVLSPGFVRSVSPERGVEVFGAWPGLRAGVFVDEPEEQLQRVARKLSLDVIQLHGQESPSVVRRIRADGGGKWRVWKTVHARGLEAIGSGVMRYAGIADGVLLDAWDPVLAGGSGRTFDWNGVADTVRRAAGTATFVAAGGMNPDNARLAVQALAPDVLDVSSGVESSPGTKDRAKVRAFVAAVRAASAGK